MARGRVKRAGSISRLVSPETKTSLYKWKEGGRRGWVKKVPVQYLPHAHVSSALLTSSS